MLLAELKDYNNILIEEFEKINDERKVLLKTLSVYISDKYKENETPKAIAICTHNSRRSHLAQIWLAVAAVHFNLPKIETFSGGTEATAFNFRAVKAIKKVGFVINFNDDPDIENKPYRIKWKAKMPAYEAFSKKYDHKINPTNNFAAIMVCNNADEACPIVEGAEFRIALPFKDPKKFDGKDSETKKYDERCRDIAREMLFVMSEIEV